MRGTPSALQVRTREATHPGDPFRKDLDAQHVLSQCPDYLAEKTALQELVEDYGHLLITSPKCHPELAGVGIEYAWGKSKMDFRRIHNNCVAADLHDNIEKSLGGLTIERAWMFARRTREYRRAYVKLGVSGVSLDDTTHKMIEHMKKECKTHRSIKDQEGAFLRNIV
jgi:hypothetical protein